MRAAGELVAGQFGRGVGGAVARRGGAHEDAGTAAAQLLRVDAGLLHGLPGRLQQQPLLRVHGDGLARRDAEEPRVEGGGAVDEAALAGV